MGMDKSAGMRDWLAQISYRIPSKLLNICILILSQKMKRFLSSSHQLERYWAEMCSLPSAFVLCCKKPTTAPGKPSPWPSPVGWAKQESVRANELCEMYFSTTHWWPESYHGAAHRCAVWVCPQRSLLMASRHACEITQQPGLAAHQPPCKNGVGSPATLQEELI